MEINYLIPKVVFLKEKNSPGFQSWDKKERTRFERSDISYRRKIKLWILAQDFNPGFIINSRNELPRISILGLKKRKPRETQHLRDFKD
jgi:hypothetical protein